MTNREKYITNKNEYDLMITIYEGKNFWCPIQIVGGKKPKCLRRRNASGYPYSDCRTCIQTWLNQETDQPKPQWQDAMMKNFLRKE